MKKDDWKKVSEEVYYPAARLVTVDRQSIEFLKEQARKNKRQRCRLCAHNDAGDVTQEMLIALCKGNYVYPHKHVNKSESFHVIEGSADMILFNEEGKITGVVELGDPVSGKTFFYRVSDERYHSLVITSDMFVFHETTKGPFIPDNRTDTVFAKWAPHQDDEQAADAYVQDLAKRREQFRREG